MSNPLEAIGLTDSECKVYETLLELGNTGAGAIIKKAELHRATVYDCLKRLMEKGLVSSVFVGGISNYQATDPDILLKILDEKASRLKKVVPELRNKQLRGKVKQEVSVYRGTKGIRTILENIIEELKNGGEYIDFGVSGLFKSVMGYYWIQWQNKKEKYNIRARLIIDSGIIKRDPSLIGNLKNTRYRFVEENYYSPTDTIIYNDKVVLFIWTATPPIAILIKNKENADGYRNHFELLWKKAIPKNRFKS
ncbi:MAG: hypothetical protein GXO64_03130 [Candidatus Micrarchaeota archaeon]|nr:hypothetical protein [Candidatus Micrarchaeota archaeon]